MQEWLKAKSIDDVQKFYEEKYLKDGVDAFRKTDWRFFFRIVEIFFPYLRPTDSILDCGSGGGHFLKGITERSIAHPYLCGIELSPSACEAANNLLKGSAYIINQNYINEVFPENSFDIVTCWGTIEHAMDIGSAFFRLAYYAKPGGLIMINAPLEFEGCMNAIKGEKNQLNNERFATKDEWLSLFGKHLIPFYTEIIDDDLVMVFRKWVSP